MSGFRASPEYDQNLMEYIETYTREVGVPPTVDQMIENVGEISSKSSVFAHLKKLEAAGLLVQKNAKGYYYPTSLENDEVMIPKNLITEACRKLLDDPKNAILVKRISMYLK